jgi:uncharacterized protein YjeT (DUF2065 family)
MDWQPRSVARWLFDSEYGAGDRLISRWVFLRALALIYFSVFFSLLFQIRGLIGPAGILPAGEYLSAVASSAGHARIWYAPTLLWFSSSSDMLMAVCWVGLFASILVMLNVFPQILLVICFICFVSFVSVASDFSGYQSDGMLLEAGFISIFLAPPGLRPGLGKLYLPLRASVLLLLWEWFRIYFESGVAKIAGGDPQWRNFTAMDEYYQNGPLPTWIGWYAHHLPHWFHAATALGTLIVELIFVWMLFLPRRWRIALFSIVTLLQIGIILTANYAFLNYLVLALAFMLVDDRFYLSLVPRHWRKLISEAVHSQSLSEERTPPLAFSLASAINTVQASNASSSSTQSKPPPSKEVVFTMFSGLKLTLTTVILCWMFYASTAGLIRMIWPGAPLPRTPVAALEPFRIADRYGLFAMMTRGRYEIEFQGSADGQNWEPYLFRYKPQDPYRPPGIYAPYQPRFDWNLWFASLGGWRANPMVPRTEELLLDADSDVLALFLANPFPHDKPKQVRAVIWQYWFSTPSEKRTEGIWWKRKLLGLYAPVLEREPSGKIGVVQWPTTLGSPQ